MIPILYIGGVDGVTIVYLGEYKMMRPDGSCPRKARVLQKKCSTEGKEEDQGVELKR